jgi:hypothetical protein
VCSGFVDVRRIVVEQDGEEMQPLRAHVVGSARTLDGELDERARLQRVRATSEVIALDKEGAGECIGDDGVVTRL